jgi:hypothetical protein
LVFDHVGFFISSGKEQPKHPRTAPMDKFKATRAWQAAQAAIDVHHQRTGRVPKVVAVALSGVRLAVTPCGALYATHRASMEF